MGHRVRHDAVASTATLSLIDILNSSTSGRASDGKSEGAGKCEVEVEGAGEG